jgi:hypothetical protein
MSFSFTLSFSSAKGLFAITFLLTVKALDHIDINDINIFTMLPGASLPFLDIVVPAIFPLDVATARDAATELAITDAVELLPNCIILGTGGTGGFFLFLNTAADTAIGLTL